MRSLRMITLACVALLALIPPTGAAQEDTTTPVNAPPSPPSLAAYPTGSATPLGASIDALLRAPAVAGAHWGIAVMALDGTPLYGLDEGKLFRPASSAKLFTTAAAMAILGPDATVTTTVDGNLNPATGVVTGTLELAGAGDSSFATNDLPYRASPGDLAPNHDLATIADQLVAKGLHRVTGNIIGNDALFAHEPAPEGWSTDDAVWGYGALPNALPVGDNELRLTLAPGDAPPSPQPGAETGARVTVEQLAPYLSVQNQLRTVPANTRPQNSYGVAAIPDHPQMLRVFGAIAAGGAPISGHVAIPDAAQYAAEALKQLLIERGVAVDGKALAFHATPQSTEAYLTAWRKPDRWDREPGGASGYGFSCGVAAPLGPVLAEKVSAPLHEDITFTLKTSANLHAEMLLLRLGLQNSCPGSPAVNGARLIRSYLVHVGLEPQDFVFYDGSGLSTKDLVTPRAEAQLLAYATKQPWFQPWKAALPVGGVDGTLSGRFHSSPLKGHVFAKTGTLGESRALAGYVQCRSGREVIFAILDDNHQPGSAADRIVMDKIVEAIATND